MRIVDWNRKPGCSYRGVVAPFGRLTSFERRGPGENTRELTPIALIRVNNCEHNSRAVPSPSQQTAAAEFRVESAWLLAESASCIHSWMQLFTVLYNSASTTVVSALAEVMRGISWARSYLKFLIKIVLNLDG